MGTRPRRAIWLSALGIALFQVVGTFGAAEDQPERRAIDALALVLVLLGPAALDCRCLGTTQMTVPSASLARSRWLLPWVDLVFAEALNSAGPSWW
jgi:hypothetical protein